LLAALTFDVPRSLVHVLLSLLLLVTQQMALLHGLSHASVVEPASDGPTLTQPAPDGGKLPNLGHDLCGRCAASAQVAFALPAALLLFAPVELGYNLATAPRTPAFCLLTTCVVQPRGPPQA
jgi:hypothetical protein